MLAVLVLYFGFLILPFGATVNEMIAAVGQQTNPQNVVLPALNFNADSPVTQVQLSSSLNNPPLIQQQPTSNSQNGVDCPNTAILLNILNILSSSLPQNDKTTLDPEKFKYVLMTVTNFLEKTPLNPENLDIYNKLKNIEAHFGKVYTPIQKESLRELDNDLRPKKLQHEKQNCWDMLNNIFNFINVAYQNVIKYCLETESCSIKNVMNIPKYYNGIHHFNPYVPIQRNSTTILWPMSENLSKESNTASTDLVNFINQQEKKGVHNIMTILNNYRPTGVNNVPSIELKNPTFERNPFLSVNPEIGQLYPPSKGINENNPSIQQLSIYKPPNMNTMTWQTIYSGPKGLTGNKYESQQYVQLLNGPFDAGIPSPYSKQIVLPNPNVDKNVNPFFDILNQIPFNSNQQRKLPSTNIKITQAEVNKIPNLVDNSHLPNLQQYLQHLENPNIQSNVPQNTLPQNVILPQGSISGYMTKQILSQYSSNQPTLGVNQNSLGYNPTPQFFPTYDEKYINRQNIFTDNTNRGNHGVSLLDLNHLLSVANQGKSNFLPIKDGVVELTYKVTRQKPVYEPHYYVKYRLPYQTFISNLQNLLLKKPNLRNESAGRKLYQELLVGSNVTDASNGLKELNYDDIVKLTSTNGTLVNAKILDNNDTTINQTLKLVQKLNSRLPVENLVGLNMNTTNLRLNSMKNNVNDINNSPVVNNSLLNANPTLLNLQRGLNPIGQNPGRVSNNPYAYPKPGQVNVGTPLKYVLPNTNVLKNPLLNSPYLPRYYSQFGR